MMRNLAFTGLLLALFAAGVFSVPACGTSSETDGATTGDGGGGGGNDGGGGGGDTGGGGEDTGGGGNDGGTTDGGGGNDGGGTPVPADQLCAKVKDWYNTFIVKCFPGLQTADLAKIFQIDCANFTVDPAKVDYDENKAGECIAEMNKLGCTGNPDEIPICKEAIKGKVADGDPCSTGFDCVDGSSCFYESTNSCGACAKEAAETESCTAAYCATGLFCNAQSTCVKRPGIDEACEIDQSGNTVIPCVESGAVAQIWCKPDSPGATTGKCAEKGVKDDACTSDDDCAFFYHCVSDKCAVKPRTSEACTYTVEQPFSQEQYSACLYLYFNDGDWCKPGATAGEGTCTPVPKKDEDCGKDNALLCGKDVWCSNLVTGGTCQDKGGKDAACNANYGGQDCASGECVSNKCTEKVSCQ